MFTIAVTSFSFSDYKYEDIKILKYFENHINKINIINVEKERYNFLSSIAKYLKDTGETLTLY